MSIHDTLHDQQSTRAVQAVANSFDREAVRRETPAPQIPWLMPPDRPTAPLPGNVPLAPPPHFAALSSTDAGTKGAMEYARGRSEMSAETYATLLEAAREVATAKAEAKLQTERANDARQAQAHQLAASGSYGGIVGEVARNVAPHVAPTLDGAFGYLLPLLGIGAGAYVGFRLSGWAGGSKADQVGAACVCALLVGVASLRVSAARNLPVRSLAV